MSIKLLVLDVDGTITDDDGNISDENIQAVAKATAKGVKVALATGRSKQGVLRIIKELNLSQDTPLILTNGALVLSDKEVWLKDFMASEEVEGVIDYGKDLGDVVITVFNPDKVYFWIPTTMDRDWTIERLYSFDLTDIEEVKNPTDLPKDNVAKLMFLAPKDEIAEEALSNWPKSLKHLKHGHSYSYLCEINNASAQKGRGLELVCDKLDIDTSDVLSVGDGDTDIPLFERSGYAVYVKRTEKIPKLPNHVVIAPDDQKNTGISWALNRYQEHWNI